MKILVTGSSGFIGEYTIREGIRRGYEIIPYDIKINRDIQDIDKFNERVDYVIHLAAEIDVNYCEDDPPKTYATNTFGTLKVINYMIKNRVKGIVFASTAAVYGNYNRPVSTNDRPNPTNVYGKSKYCAENIIIDSAKRYGFKYYILRYFNVYGMPISKENGHGVIHEFIKRVIYKEPITIYGGEQVRDFVHVEDVAKINFEIINKKSGIYNISTGKDTSIQELVEILGYTKTIHKPMKENEIVYSVGVPSIPLKKRDLKDEIINYMRSAMTQRGATKYQIG